MVRCMKNKNKTIDEYIVEAKNDIYAYILIWIIFFNQYVRKRQKI